MYIHSPIDVFVYTYFAGYPQWGLLEHFVCVLSWKFRFVTVPECFTYPMHISLSLSLSRNWKFPNGINQSYQFICYKSNQFLYGLYSMWNLCMHWHSDIQAGDNRWEWDGREWKRHDTRQIAGPKNKRAGLSKANRIRWLDFIKIASNRFGPIRRMACRRTNDEQCVMVWLDFSWRAIDLCARLINRRTAQTNSSGFHNNV